MGKLLHDIYFDNLIDLHLYTIHYFGNCNYLFIHLFKLNVYLASDMIVDTKQMTYKTLLKKQMLCSS